MTTPRLYKDMIPQPRLWQLYVAIGQVGLEVMAYNPLEEHSLMTASIPYEGNGGLKDVEDAVYGNPLLLCDFKKITFLFRDTPFTFFPTEIASDGEMIEKITQEITGNVDNDIMVDEIPLLATALAYTPDIKTVNFLRRTFPAAKIHHRLSRILQYWHATARAIRPLTTHVNLLPDKTDIASFSGNKLMFANTFPTPTVDDRLYFIMAVRQSLGAQADVPIIISGDRQLRDELTEPLSHYAERVLPAVFPAAMFKAGGQTAMNTPLDLVVSPLCE